MIVIPVRAWPTLNTGRHCKDPNKMCHITGLLQQFQNQEATWIRPVFPQRHVSKTEQLVILGQIRVCAKMATTREERSAVSEYVH